MSTLKTINVIHPSGSTNNIVNDASGNVTVGNNLTVTGTATVGGTAVVAVAPGTSGNLLTSNGSAWTSAAATTADGSITPAKISTGGPSWTSGGVFSFNSGYGSVAVAYGCRAWVNFDGTTSPGTINASANVSSVTRPATGTYTINFTSAMPDANYSAVGSCVGDGNFTGRGPCEISGATRPTTSAVTFLTNALQNVSTARNSPLVCISVFR